MAVRTLQLKDKYGFKKTATDAKMKQNIQIVLSKGTEWDEGALKEFT